MRMTTTIIRLWKYRDKRTNKTLPFDKIRHTEISNFISKHAIISIMQQNSLQIYKDRVT